MATETEFDIPAIEISTFELTLVGDSPLIVHAWSEKAKREILDKQMKVAKTKVRSVRNPASARAFIFSKPCFAASRGLET